MIGGKQAYATLAAAQYLKHWLEMMKADNRAISSAAARAHAFLRSLQPKS